MRYPVALTLGVATFASGFAVTACAADAQGIVRGARSGAVTGERAAGPVGGLVGGVVGGAVGGVVGGVRGVLGLPTRPVPRAGRPHRVHRRHA